MVQLSVKQVVEVLQVGREIAFDRVWMAASTAVRRFAGRVELYLIALVAPGSTMCLSGREKPKADYAMIPVVSLRRDGETLILDVRRDGIPRVRSTTTVVRLNGLTRDETALAYFLDVEIRGGADHRSAKCQVSLDGSPGRVVSTRWSMGSPGVQAPNARTTGTLPSGAGGGRQFVAAPDAAACAAHVE